jgi:glutamate N-acetyltransferase / amino-acid N-acetyltransferase
MTVTFPRGFRAAGVCAGLKPSGRDDLGLLVAEPSPSAAGVFTTNAFAAAPVRLCKERLAGGSARAVLVNSGQANAATGEAGERDAAAATRAAADALGLDPGTVLGCSTGVIGEPIHMGELLAAVPRLVERLSADGGEAFARAIMTTDTVPKEASAQRGRYRVGGAAKGVGMISPNLATMLVFVTTDAPLPFPAIGQLVGAILEPAFESLSVDACSSTNDSVLLLASGAAAGDPVVPGSPAWNEVSDAVHEVADSLLSQLAADAEGATHVLLVDVEGAASTEDARAVARAIADSPLVKTAAFGGDPNPGRLVQAIGSAGAGIEPTSVGVWIGGAKVVDAGVIHPSYFASGGGDDARIEMKGAEIHYRVRLGDGPGRSRSVGCDLSYEYVRINGEYTT